MSSNEEKQAIANELRYFVAYPRDVLPADWWCRLQEIVTGAVDFANPQEAFLALADLIEPGVDEGDAHE